MLPPRAGRCRPTPNCRAAWGRSGPAELYLLRKSSSSARADHRGFTCWRSRKYFGNRTQCVHSMAIPCMCIDRMAAGRGRGAGGRDGHDGGPSSSAGWAGLTWWELWGAAGGLWALLEGKTDIGNCLTITSKRLDVDLVPNDDSHSRTRDMAAALSPPQPFPVSATAVPELSSAPSLRSRDRRRWWSQLCCCFPPDAHDYCNLPCDRRCRRTALIVVVRQVHCHGRFQPCHRGLWQACPEAALVGETGRCGRDHIEGR
jgi:hypothetical protein